MFGISESITARHARHLGASLRRPRSVAHWRRCVHEVPLQAPYRHLTAGRRIRMITCMRTTVIIDDELLRQAKRSAAERDVTLSDIINDALRTRLARKIPDAAPFQLVTYGRSRDAARHEPADFAQALDQEDRDRLRS